MQEDSSDREPCKLLKEKEHSKPPILLRALKSTRFLTLFVIAALILAFTFLSDRQFDEILEALKELGILPFYIGIVIFPIFGAPITPFYLLAAAAFPLWQNIVFLAVSLFVHFLLAYYFATHLFRKTIQNLIAKSRFNLPTVKDNNHVQVAILVRLAPGLAVALKTYILGALGIRFSVFITVSWITTFLFSLFVLILGHNAMEGNWTGFIILAVVLVVLSIGVRLYFKKLQQRNSEAPEPNH